MKTRSSRQRGSAMIVVAIVVTSLMLMIIGLLNTTTARSQSEIVNSGEIAWFRKADSGVSHARLKINRCTTPATDVNWLAYWAGSRSDSPIARNTPNVMRPVGFNVSASNTLSWLNGGYAYFDMPAGSESASTPPGDTARVRVFILNPSQSETDPYARVYMIVARMETAGLKSGETIARSVAWQVQPQDTFAKYARFTTSNLSITASGVTYSGEVHSNGTVSVSGSNDLFTEVVSSTQNVTNSGSNNIFTKGTQSGVPSETPPSTAEVLAEGLNLPGGSSYTAGNEYTGCSIAYDVRNSDFKALCAKPTTATPPGCNYTPTVNDTLATTITLDRDKATVTTIITKAAGGTVTLNQTLDNTNASTRSSTGVAIPDNGFIYVNGTVTISGNMSRRATLMATGSITVPKPLRYVDDSGAAQYNLYNKNNTLATFNSSTNAWEPSSSEKWQMQSALPSTTQAQPSYVANPSWTMPATGYPTLGLVSSTKLYVNPRSSGNTQAEVHAYIFSTGNVMDGSTSSGGKNLYILGGLASTIACPIGGWSAPSIVYDKKLSAAPPPHFPLVTRPAYSCWHEVETDVVSAANNTYKLVNHDYVGRTVGSRGNTWQ